MIIWNLTGKEFILDNTITIPWEAVESEYYPTIAEELNRRNYEYFKKLLAVAKAGKYLVDRTDNYYLHAEIKDPLMQNLRNKIIESEKE